MRKRNRLVGCAGLAVAAAGLWLAAAGRANGQEKKEDVPSKSDAVPVEISDADKKHFKVDELKKVEEGIRRARKTVVRLDLQGGRGTGSGVVIKWKDKLYFVSAAHNFRAGAIDKIDMPGPLKLEESEYRVEKIAIDHDSDVAAFRVLEPRDTTSYVEVNENPKLSQGTPVLLLTYPLGRGLKKGFPVHDVALISSTSNKIRARDVYMSQRAGAPDGEKVTIGPGSSGGGMFDLDGKLIGIFHAGNGSKEQGEAVAIPVSKVLKLIKE